jgi:hypothetical protein
MAPVCDKHRESMKTTDNSANYRKLLKYHFGGCPICPWHGGENRSRRPRHVSWKQSRRQQWRTREA